MPDFKQLGWGFRGVELKLDDRDIRLREYVHEDSPRAMIQAPVQRLGYFLWGKETLNFSAELRGARGWVLDLEELFGEASEIVDCL